MTKEGRTIGGASDTSRPTDPAKASALRLLLDWNFALYWLGSSVSRTGNYVYDVTLGYSVYLWTGSALTVGGVLATFTACQLACVLFGGVLTDRLSKRWLICGTELIASAVVGGMAIVTASGKPPMVCVYLMSGLLGVLSSMHLPALRAVLPELTSREILPAANALLGITNSVTRVAGPALGGFLLAGLGPTGAFTCDAATFVISAATMFAVSLTPDASLRRNRVGRDLADGIRAAVGTRVLTVSLIASTLATLLVLGPLSVVLPVLIRSHHLPLWLIGGVGAAQGCGALLGGFILARRPWRGGALTYLLLVGLLGVGALLLAVTNQPAVILAAGLILGGASASSIIRQSMIQQGVCQEQLGRAFSVDMFATFSLLPVGYALAGAAISAIGARASLAVCGAAQLGAIAVLALAATRDTGNQDRQPVLAGAGRHETED